MDHESRRSYIYNIIVKCCIELQDYNFDDISDECYSTLCDELVELSDNELINQSSRIYEISLK